MTSTPPRRWLRVLLPSVLVLVWLTAAGMGGPLFGKVEEVSSNDPAAYLPTSAEATRVQELRAKFSEAEGIPAIVLVTSRTALEEARLDAFAEALSQVAALPGVAGEVSPPIPSEDGLAAQAFVPIDAEQGVAEALAEVEATLEASGPEGVEVWVTGPAGFTADLAGAFAGIDGLLLAVALGAVLLILLLVYRSFLLPLVVLATSMFALCVALLVVWWLAKWEVLLLSGQTQGILFILVIGAATDYSLLMVARYREELRSVPDKLEATRRAVKGSVEPILASGGTVIAGLLCLLLSDLKSNSGLGPVAAIGIVFAMLSALTFLPATLVLLGRAAFWPRRPVYEEGHVSGEVTEGVWARVARFVERRPRPVWIATAAVLALGCVGVIQLQADGVPRSELVIGSSQARDGLEALAEHFPGGSGEPAVVHVPADRLQEAAGVLLAAPGVASVTVLSADSPSGTVGVTEDGVQAFGPPGTEPPAPTVVDGAVMLQATLTEAADSPEAEETVRALRTALHPLGALVGGETAVAIDTNDASIHDRNLIIPVVLLVITLILMLLLRSVLAPLLLLATTVLSFGTAMGVSALVFNGVLDFPGADAAVPLYGFVFLVALGIDYNIFLMTRVREEALHRGTREGVLRGLRITGGVITSAGIVLAATFAALSVIPVLFLVQLAFIVAFGVLLDTFVVRSLLVPALVHDIGSTVWWPSRLSREDGPASAPTA